MASGGIYAFPDREVPDTFNLLADFAKGHSLVLSSSMANSTHIPGLIRGQKGTIVMVDHGRFEGETDHITGQRPKRSIATSSSRSTATPRSIFRSRIISATRTWQIFSNVSGLARNRASMPIRVIGRK